MNPLLSSNKFSKTSIPFLPLLWILVSSFLNDRIITVRWIKTFLPSYFGKCALSQQEKLGLRYYEIGNNVFPTEVLFLQSINYTTSLKCFLFFFFFASMYVRCQLLLHGSSLLGCSKKVYLRRPVHLTGGKPQRGNNNNH